MAFIYHNDPKKAREVFDRLNSLINVVLGAVNTVAGRTLYEAYEELSKNKKLFQQRSRYCAKNAKRLFDTYERLHLQNFGDRYQLFIDYLDCVEDEVMPHVKKMYWSIKSVLDKYNEKDSALKAKIELARTMIEYSCCVYDRLIEDTRKASGYNFDKWMRPARLTGCFYWWNELAILVCKTDKDKTIDLNADANCTLAFQIIERVLTSEDTLNRAGYEALKLNPEMVREIDGKDFEELKDKFG